MRRLATVVLGALIGSAPACSPPAEPPGRAPAPKPGLDTVDVTAPPDAEASLEGDRPQGAARSGGGAGIAGALPDGFPKDVPLPRPSSLVDFGERSITLEVAGGVEGVRTSYLRQLAGAGFAPREGGRWQRGARLLGIEFAGVSGATRVTIEIVPSS